MVTAHTQHWFNTHVLYCVRPHRLLISEIGGEMRFGCAVAKRLQSMGAMMSGSRRAGHEGSSSLGFDSFNVDSNEGKDALKDMYELLRNPLADSQLPFDMPAVPAEDLCEKTFQYITLWRNIGTRHYSYPSDVRADAQNIRFGEVCIVSSAHVCLVLCPRIAF